MGLFDKKPPAEILSQHEEDEEDPYDDEFLEETSSAAAEHNVELHNRRANWDRTHAKADEPIVTIAVATHPEKHDLEAKIRAAGGADSMMATVSVPMPPEMLAIIAHWKAMGQMPVLFIKPTALMNEIRVIALRLPVEVASRI